MEGSEPTRGEGRSEEGKRARSAEERSELAEQRTEWSSVRTLLAKERTFSAWLRTGMAALLAGLAVIRFLGRQVSRGGGEEGTLWATLLGTLLVVTSTVIFAVGFWSYRKTLRELETEGVRGIPTWILASITGILIVGSLVGLLLVL